MASYKQYEQLGKSGTDSPPADSMSSKQPFHFLRVSWSIVGALVLEWVLFLHGYEVRKTRMGESLHALLIGN